MIKAQSVVNLINQTLYRYQLFHLGIANVVYFFTYANFNLNFFAKMLRLCVFRRFYYVFNRRNLINKKNELSEALKLMKEII